MPGPLLIVTIAQSAKKGIWSALLLTIGHAILEAMLVAGLVMGLIKLVQKEIIFTIVGLAGGAMLMWMGAMLAKSALSRKDIAFLLEDRNRGRNSSLLSGILVSLSNPYWILWWLTIGLAYLIAAIKFGIAGIILFFIGHILADFIWYGFVGFAIVTGRKFFNQTVFKVIFGICGAFLLFWGGKFIFDAAKAIAG
ncbi:MAG: LysE family translocator [Actinobacteria bacterium]|nr:LysE family translocator [Actinomycetota bacterium]